MTSKQFGYNDDLFILAFDHRGSFQKKMFGIEGTPTPEQTSEIASYKRIIFEGFKKAVEGGVPKQKGGILLDEQFGAQALEEAKELGLLRACPAEKSGQNEFDFEYGEEFGAHIQKFEPTFVKVLVRYNPEDDAEMNTRQTKRLKRLSEYCQENGRKFIFELLVPATQAQMDSVQGDKKRYDSETRPELMVRSIRELQEGGVEADIWKLEGLDTEEAAKKVAAQCKTNGRDHVGVVVLGRGENDEKVRHWLSTAARVPGFIGFAVGRTIFWEPLKGVREGRHSKEEAVEQIASNYRGFYDTWVSARQNN